MKKIFTLISMALMAIGVNAQTWAVPSDYEVSSGASVTSVDGVTLNIGNARDGNTWTIGDAAGDLGEGNDVLGTTKYIKGSENAKTVVPPRPARFPKQVHTISSFLPSREN